MVFQDNVLAGRSSFQRRPPIWAGRPGPHCLRGAQSRRSRGPRATPSTRTLLYSRIKTGPGGNFVPKFITQSCNRAPSRPSSTGSLSSEAAGLRTQQRERSSRPSRCARSLSRLVRFFITKLARFIATTRSAPSRRVYWRREVASTQLSRYAPARTFASR